MTKIKIQFLNKSCIISVNTTRQQIAFTAQYTVGGTLGKQQAVKYNQVVTNIGQAYDARDGHFTAPVAGVYSFSLTGMAHQTTALYLDMVKNSQFLTQIYSTTDVADSASVTVHIHLDVNDHVWVENGGGAGAHLNVGSFNIFSGILEKAD